MQEAGWEREVVGRGVGRGEYKDVKEKGRDGRGRKWKEWGRGESGRGSRAEGLRKRRRGERRAKGVRKNGRIGL